MMILSCSQWFPSVLTMHYVGTEDWLCPPSCHPRDLAITPALFSHPVLLSMFSFTLSLSAWHVALADTWLEPWGVWHKARCVCVCVWCLYTSYHKYVHADKCLPLDKHFSIALGWSGWFSERCIRTLLTCLHSTHVIFTLHRNVCVHPLAVSTLVRAAAERGCPLFPI